MSWRELVVHLRDALVLSACLSFAAILLFLLWGAITLVFLL